jgi:hypothetical protein
MADKTDSTNTDASSDSGLDGYMLTTVDNPFNPFTHFSEWFAYDTGMGYHTCSFLDLVVRSSDDLSEADQHDAIQQAIDRIVRENVLGLYRKVLEPSE